MSSSRAASGASSLVRAAASRRSIGTLTRAKPSLPLVLVHRLRLTNRRALSGEILSVAAISSYVIARVVSIARSPGRSSRPAIITDALPDVSEDIPHAVLQDGARLLHG